MWNTPFVAINIPERELNKVNMTYSLLTCLFVIIHLGEIRAQDNSSSNKIYVLSKQMFPVVI